jgi:hypothetical protein
VKLLTISLKVGDRIVTMAPSQINADDESDRVDTGDVGTIVKVVEPFSGDVIEADDGDLFDTSRDGYAEVQWPKYKKLALVHPQDEGKYWRREWKGK